MEGFGLQTEFSESSQTKLNAHAFAGLKKWLVNEPMTYPLSNAFPQMDHPHLYPRAPARPVVLPLLGSDLLGCEVEGSRRSIGGRFHKGNTARPRPLPSGTSRIMMED